MSSFFLNNSKQWAQRDALYFLLSGFVFQGFEKCTLTMKLLLYISLSFDTLVKP